MILDERLQEAERLRKEEFKLEWDQDVLEQERDKLLGRLRLILNRIESIEHQRSQLRGRAIELETAVEKEK